MTGILLPRLAFSANHVLRLTPCVSILPSRTKVGVHEVDRKSGYRKNDSTPGHLSLIKQGLPMLKRELKLFKEETKDKFYADHFMDLTHGDYQYAWKMNSQEQIDQWVVTADRDNNEGNSKAGLDLNKNKMAMFHGYLSQTVPKDGIQKRSGYARMRSPSNFKSFKRKIPYDWTLFNCLVMRVRGDGRSYMLTIGMDRYYDIHWNDQYHYTLYTRGGPYWQTAKIPFSKFYLTSKGRIQDKQEPFPLERVSNLGISVGDGNEGPFSLEIDYIACLFDENHQEEFAYEMYDTDPGFVGT